LRVAQGGRITCLALTDTQLLLGSTAGAVQHFDLFSRSQQLITRHGSSVTCLLAQQQQQQGLAATAAAEQQEDWHVIVGTADGQVCTSNCCSMGLHASLNGLAWDFAVLALAAAYVHPMLA
jgi:hypothetical protein